MNDKNVSLVRLTAEIGNLKIILEQFESILQSAKNSNDRIIHMLDSFINEHDPLVRRLNEKKD